MKRFAKKCLTGGVKSKKRTESTDYLIKTLNLVKYYIKKFAGRVLNLYKKLTFSAYDKIGGEGTRAQRFLRDKDNQSEIAFREGVDAITDRCSELISGSYLSNFARNGFVRSLSYFLTPCRTNLLNSRGWCYNFVKKISNLYKKLTFVAYDKIGGEDAHVAQASGYDFDNSNDSEKIERALVSRTSLSKNDYSAWFQRNSTSWIRKLAQFLFFRPINLLNSRGSVLIEFAVCMPILIILLFYINDLVRLKRYYSQTEFVAQQMANILQNISQKRGAADSSQLKITANDIRYAASLAYLSFFPGTTELNTATNTSDLGYSPLGWIYCVKGNEDSTASVLWRRRFNMATIAYSPIEAVFDERASGRTNIKNLTNATPSEIYPTLKINPGEMKILIETSIHCAQVSWFFLTDGRNCNNIPYSQAFGLRLFKISPPKTRDGANNDAIFFHTVVIFTPKPGLFDETAPV